MSNNYEQAVRRMAKLNADELISNSEPEHAATLYKVFFENARQSVLLLCKNFDARVFSRPDVLVAFKKAVERGVKFNVIVQEPSEAGNAFRKSFIEKSASRPKQLQILDAYTKQGEDPEKIAAASKNFCVVDEKAFRWEENRTECVATASMNRPAIATKLADLFKECRAALID